MKKLLIAIALIASSHAHADEASKRAKIAKLMVVQGLEQMMQQQMDQSTASLSGMAGKLFDSMVGDKSAADPAMLKRLRAVHERFLASAGTMFSAKEVVDSWSASYGKDLTEAEVDKILAYYMSPTGRKDIAASKAAMTEMGETLSTETEKRMFALLEQFKKDMDAAAKNPK